MNGVEIQISTNADGRIEACYLLLSSNKVARTEEVLEDLLMVDYDRKGNLIGIEILGPVKLVAVTKHVDRAHKKAVRKALERITPDLVAA
jgi:uncharacterized protein YuzE